MIGQVQTKDGQKIVEPISGSIPTGNPVGTLLTTYKKIQPRNYLYCDGSTFNASQYPALYLYLGTNVLPDYRECVMVGAEQNTTDNIATHDVYAQGEFKDDSVKVAKFGVIDGQATISSTGNGTLQASENASFNGTWESNKNTTIMACTGEYGSSVRRVLNIHAGTTTHGKQKAVYVYIKAVDGVDISDEDTFLVTVKNFVEEKNSYSTTEMLTGGKWIDGKPIYKISFDRTFTNNETVLTNVDTLVHQYGMFVNGAILDAFPKDAGNSGYNHLRLNPSTHIVYVDANGTYRDIITVEYTKTTD